MGTADVRPSAARDDRVSCIQDFLFKAGKALPSLFNLLHIDTSVDSIRKGAVFLFNLPHNKYTLTALARRCMALRLKSRAFMFSRESFSPRKMQT